MFPFLYTSTCSSSPLLQVLSASQQYRGVMVGGALGVSEKGGGPLSPHMEGEEGGDEKGQDNDDEDELLF